MIISKRHHFIFTAIPKTGTHSVRQALREHLAEEDLEQVGLFAHKRFPFEELARIRHGHLTLDQVRPLIGEETFATFFKFAFVRNPFDRFVSYCAFMTRQTGEFAADPKGVMKHILFDMKPEHHVLFRPQYLFVSDTEGRPLTDFIGRVEDMQSSYMAICNEIGIPSRQLDKVNSSNRGPYQHYYDARLINGVRSYYAKDLELFGYAFD